MFRPYKYKNDDYYNNAETPYYSVIIKYNRNGKVIWKKMMPISEFDDIVETVIVDASNSVLLWDTQKEALWVKWLRL